MPPAPPKPPEGMALLGVVWKLAAELGDVVEAGSRARGRRVDESAERDRAEVEDDVVDVRSLCWCRARGARALCVVAAVMVMAVYVCADVDHEQLPVAVVGSVSWVCWCLVIGEKLQCASCALVQAAVRVGTGVPTSESGLPEGAWGLGPT